MKIISCIMICALILITVGCSESKEGNFTNFPKMPSIELPTPSAISESDSKEDFASTDQTDSTPVLGIVKEDEYYSIKYNQSLVQLRNDEKSVAKILGDPIKASQARQLGEGADTFSEMYSKELYYEGLTLKLLGMEINNLWLSEIIIDERKYETSEGIQVGDTLDGLKNAYLNIKYTYLKIDEHKPNSRIYEYFQGELGFFAEFIINENDVIEKIHMYTLFD
jgi:hypothetical protein